MGSVGHDIGPYIHHITFYPEDGHVLAEDGTRTGLNIREYINVLKDVNKARCAMHNDDEYYGLTNYSEIGKANEMWVHEFDNKCGYPRRCVATRNRIGRNETNYVEIALGNERPVLVRVEDRSIRSSRQRLTELGKMKQMREPFRTNIVKSIINSTAETMTGDTTVNLPRIRYFRNDAPMKIAHAVMAYTRLRSAAEDISNKFNIQKVDIIDYQRNANNFIVLLNLLLGHNYPAQMKTLGDKCIITDVFGLHDRITNEPR